MQLLYLNMIIGRSMKITHIMFHSLTNALQWCEDADHHFTRLFLTFSTVIVIAALCYYYSSYTKSDDNNSSRPLPPGPRGLPVVGSLFALEPELHSYFARLAREHGPVLKLRLGSKLGVVVSSPSAASQILRDEDVTFANRDMPVAARVATYGGLDIAWASYGPEWRTLRKLCVLKMLSKSTLDQAYGLRRKEVRKTVGYLYGRAGSPVNLVEQVFLLQLNVITGMMWGGTVDGERAKMASEFKSVVSEITEMYGKPNVSDFYPGLGWLDLQGVERRMKVLVSRLDEIFETMINKRVKNLDGDKNSYKDFLQLLLELVDDAKTPLTLNHVKATLMDMVLGGSDTASNMIEFAMAEMMNNPEIMRKAQQEVDGAVGEDGIVEESHIHSLTYLQAIMMETLRLHPVLPMLVPHSPSQTCLVGGYTIPKGSRVFINVWAIHRDPSVWENPLEFVPERFLGDGTKWDYSGSDFRYLPFGSGRRICAGIGMAERTVLYSLAKLLHSFEWKLPQGEKMDLEEKFGIVLKKRTPLVAIPTPRLSHPSLYR